MDMKPIDCYCYTHKDGTLEPLKIRYFDENDDKIVVKIDRLVLPEPNACRNDIVKIECGSFQNGIQKRFKLIFNKKEIKWYLSI